MQNRLQFSGKQLRDYNLPEMSHEQELQVYQAINENMENAQQPLIIQEELQYDIESLQQTVNERLDGTHSLRPAQRQFYDMVMNSVQQGAGCAFFLDARGGTGKTFTLNTILAAVPLGNDSGLHIFLLPQVESQQCYCL